MKKKILFVTYSIHGGGSEKRLQSILRGLNREKFEPHLCVLSPSGREADVIPPDVRLHRLPAPMRPASLFLTWHLFKLLKELRPDKIFSVLWSVNTIAAAAARLAGIPAILNEATTPSESVKRYSFPALRKRLISFFYRGAADIITVSDYAAADLVKNFAVPAAAITTVHNGIMAAETEKASLEYNPGTTGHILACGGLNWWKNYSLLIKALAGESGRELVILGTGPLEGRLRDEAAKAGVKLSLPGHKENPYPYFRQAAVFVLTSRYEGFPNVLLEAMACGTPVISVDCPGGIREIIEDGKTGLIVPQENPAALRQAITRLLDDPTLAKRLAEQARVKLATEFTFKKMLTAYERILGEEA